MPDRYQNTWKTQKIDERPLKTCEKAIFAKGKQGEVKGQKIIGPQLTGALSRLTQNPGCVKLLPRSSGSRKPSRGSTGVNDAVFPQ